MIALTGAKTNNPTLVNPDHVMFITYADTGAIPILGQAPPPKVARLAFRTGGTVDVKETIEEIAEIIALLRRNRATPNK